jgi:trigger factor
MTEITVEKTSEDLGSKVLSVTVPQDRVEEAEARAVQYYAKRAKVPGFRKGKVPAQVIKKRFGDAIRQTVLEEVIREGVEMAQTQESLTAVLDRSVRNVKFTPGAPVEFELVVEVRPEIQLEHSKGFHLTRTVPPVTDTEVEAQLRALQEQKAAWLPIEGEKPTEGQLVRVEVAALEGAGAGETKAYQLVLGKGEALPAIEEQITELLPGETREASIRYPDDDPDEARRGTSRRFRITLHEVKRQELPSLDDAFAREVGDFDTLQALEAAIRHDLARAAEREADARVRDQLIHEVVEANRVEAPPSMVRRLVTAYARAYQISPERFEQFANEFRPVAEAQVKRELVLHAVAEAEGLSATEAEVDARVAEIAEAQQRPVAEVYASLQKSERLPDIERSITEDKTFTFLLEHSTVDEVSA